MSASLNEPLLSAVGFDEDHHEKQGNEMGFRSFAKLMNLLIWVGAFQAAGCGYTLQNSHNELLEKEGIRTVFVKPLINGTYKPGVENTVYNALVRTVLAHRRVRLARNPATADAILEGSVTIAEYGVSGSSLASAIPPGVSGPYALPVIPQSNVLSTSHLDLGAISVATLYTASLGCTFVLNRNAQIPGKPKVIWSGSFSRSKPFPASNQLDVPGTTSALINESEFERALGEMATSMMDDVHESMLAMF